MRILFLGYNSKETSLIDFLRNRKHEVVCISDKTEKLTNFDMVISFGYRFLFKKYQLLNLKRPIINLHISYLPYNRGTHPNFWSHYEGTPSGVTIHEIDDGVDTGPIINQKKIVFTNNQLSLKESYKILKLEIEKLFTKNILLIETFQYETTIIKELGTYHEKRDLPAWVDWNMKIEDIKK